MSTITRTTIVLVLLACALNTAPAGAETINCTSIATLPVVITAQGVHCFTHDLTTNITSGNAIDIHASNRQNLTLKNGTIRGYFRGIWLEDSGTSQGHVVEDIRADQNTFAGMIVQGDGSIVRNNQVVATGATMQDLGAIGIQVAGNGPRVLNNDVISVVGQGDGPGWGILLDAVTGGMVVNNRISDVGIGILFLNGSTGKYRDNLTFNATTTPFSGGTSAGNNN